MSGRVELRLVGSVDHLNLCWQVGEVLLASIPFGPDAEETRHHVLLAVQEALTNVLRYAHALDDRIPIDVTMIGSRLGFEVEIRDRGAPFDPRPYAVERAFEEALPAQEGGLGLSIVRRVMDDIAYEREDGCNVLRLTRHAAGAAVAKAGG
jgi:anti-sigma regulatory factor (Ser/Thr protein kinase)